MRRIPLALALVGAFAVTGCMSGSKAPAGTDSGGQKGEAGVNYIITVPSPAGGYISSVPAGISCGQGIDVLCSATFAWTQQVVLTANPTAPNALVAWAGDCSGTGTCTINAPVNGVSNAGADKTVVAVFGAPGSGHGNFMDGAIHGPAYDAYMAQTAGALVCTTCHGPTLEGKGIAPSCSSCHPNPGALPVPCTGTGCPAATVPPFKNGQKTGLVAAITSVTPNTTATVTFTLKDKNGANVDVTGSDGKNLPMPLTMAIVNYAIDAGGNALPYKNDLTAAPSNPATVTPFAAITSMSLTSGTLPVATSFAYPDGALTQAAPAKSCTVASPCTCSAANPCAYSGAVGFGFRKLTPTATATYGACSAASPCTCISATPCAPALPTTNGPGMLTFTGGVYTYTFAVSPFNAAVINNVHTAWLAAYRRENTGNGNLAGVMNTTVTPAAPVAASNDGMAYTAANVQFNFDSLDGTPVPSKRDIVSDAACAKCHDGFKAKAIVGLEDFHSSARVGAGYCNICHYEGRGTNGFADSATFVHRLHGAGTLTYDITSAAKTTGYKAGNPFLVTAPTACSTTAPCVCTVLQPCSDTTFHGMTVTYPQDPRNCTECHDSSTASRAGQYLTRPTIAACGSCHDKLATTFLPVGSAVTSAAHTGGAGLGNATCAGCHTPASITARHQPIQPPASDSCFALNNISGCNTNTNAGYIAATGVVPAGADTIAYEIQSVGTWLDGTTVRPQMVFRMLQNGVAVNFGTYGTGKTELITGYVGGPSIYWVWAVPQDGISAPADFNASTSNWLKQCWQSGVNCNLTRDAGTGFYTVQNKAAALVNATMLTGGIGYSYNMVSSQPLTQVNIPAYPAVDTNVTAGTVAFGATAAQACATTTCVVKVGGLVVTTDNAWKVATGFTGRRAIVDNEKCNACHGQLGVEPTFHAGQRNDGPSCSWCHTPNRTSSGWSANASTFIHGIHGASKRSVGFNWHAACQFGATWNAATFQCERVGVGEGPAIWYPEVEYPGFLRDCLQCHVQGAINFGNAANSAAAPNLLYTTMATGTYAATGAMSNSPYVTVGPNYGSGPSFSAATGVLTAGNTANLIESPIAAACTACHDTDSAKSHMENDGGARVRAVRGAGFVPRQESCLDCHGQGKSWDVEKMHLP